VIVSLQHLLEARQCAQRVLQRLAQRLHSPLTNQVSRQIDFPQLRVSRTQGGRQSLHRGGGQVTVVQPLNTQTYKDK